MCLLFVRVHEYVHVVVKSCFIQKNKLPIVWQEESNDTNEGVVKELSKKNVQTREDDKAPQQPRDSATKCSFVLLSNSLIRAVLHLLYYILYLSGATIIL